MVIIFMSFTGIIFLLGRNILPTFFTTENDVILITANLLIITTFFQISDGVQVVAQGALRGLSDTRMPTLITFIAYWLIALPLAYFNAFILGWGAIGIWIALAIGLTVSGILLSTRFMNKSKALLEPSIR